MDPISPKAQHILRFSGVHQQVLNELENHSLQAHSEVLFGRDSGVGMFISQGSNNQATVEFQAEKEHPLQYIQGYLRSLCLQLTGEDILLKRVPEQANDLFECPIERLN